MPPFDNPPMRPSTSPPPDLLQYCQKALHNFLTPTPASRFQIVHTTSTRDEPLPFQSKTPQTIAILDSSFNPPTRAHLSLATSILRPPPGSTSTNTTTPTITSSSTTTTQKTQQAKEGYGAPRFYSHPTRLLLLFSTHNADKDPVPAAFEYRLALMVLFAHDIVALYTSGRRRGGQQQQPPPPSTKSHLDANTETSPRSDGKRVDDSAADRSRASEMMNTDTTKSDSRSNADSTNMDIDIDIDIDIDVALTSEPFYSDKSAAISAPGIYDSLSPTKSTSFPSPSPTSTPPTNIEKQTKATHIHLLGHDTFLRILTPHYYSQQGHDPPLSALGDFFSRHGLRVTLRASPPAAGDGDNMNGDGNANVNTESDPGLEQEIRKDRREKEKEDQLSTHRSLSSGSLSHLGGRREWSSRIEVVDPEAGVEGMSSTVVRRAVGKGDWDVVRGYCTPGVVEGIGEWGLYL